MAIITKDSKGELKSLGFVMNTGGYSDVSGIKKINGLLSEEQIVELWTMPDGLYTLQSEQYGSEILFINQENLLFKRLTGGYDYTYDFTLEEWVISSGGGSGSGGGNLLLRLVEPSSGIMVVATGSKANVTFYFNSSQTDKGTAYVYIGGSLKETTAVKKGNNTINLAKFIKDGINTVVIKVMDTTGTSSELNVAITGVSLKLTSTFEEEKAYYGKTLNFTYYPSGGVNVDVSFTIDNNLPQVEHVNANGNRKEVNLDISSLEVGIHKLLIEMQTVLENDTVLSIEPLVYNLIIVKEGSEKILISSKFNQTTAREGEVISVDYVVYDLKGLNLSNIQYTPVKMEFSVNDRVVQTLPGVNTGKKSWTYVLTEQDIGETILKMKATSSDGSRSSEITFNLNVSELEIDVKVEEDFLELSLDAKNRSNEESNPTTWTFGNVSATLTDFNWSTNGWLNDENGETYLRLNGRAKVEIPFKIFATEPLTTGKTIEFTFRTNKTSNYNTEIISCHDDYRGIKIFANKCILQSSQLSVETMFKEEEKIKIAFVIEQKTSTGTNLVKTFINGVLSGLNQYSDSDEFKQAEPANIIIGSNESEVDVYSIRIYNNDMLDHQIVNNFMADLNPVDLIETYKRNNILVNEKINYDLVKNLIPVMIVTGEMPPVKGEKTTVKVKYNNPFNSKFDFEYEGVIWDIQGTSSQYYPRKNYKGKFPETFSFYEGAIPEHTYTFKADYMESSHSHNTGNAKIATKFSPKFPTQTDDNGVRNSIYGFPIMVFVRTTEESELICYGVFNFNNDKGNSDTIGLTTDKAESWEFKNNTSKRCNFLTDSFDTIYDEATDSYLKASDDFEARYPKDYTDYTAFKRVVSWVYSTKNNIEKFKTEFEQYFNKEFCLYYYVMMDIMLAVDSRAKNMFLDTVDGVIWYPRWYDIDTTYGLNNEGGLQFSYGLEQTDEVDGVAVYNGNDSVLWNNFGVAFASEIKDYYNELRKTLTYESMLEILEGEQVSKISETMYNSDAEFKYIGPLVEDNDSTYIYVAQGSRIDHLKWWLANRFKYLDSKYEYSDFIEDYITMRLYTPEQHGSIAPSGDFEITPYIDMYPQIKFGSTVVKTRAQENKVSIVYAPTGLTFNNTETIIYGAKNILDVGDLANKYARTMDFSKATRLKRLKIGDTASDYLNTNLTSLSIGNNKMLEYLNISRCSNLKGVIDLSGCTNIKEIYAGGTSITAIQLADGGNLETMVLPGTVATVDIQNQPFLNSLSFDRYDSIQSIKILNTPTLDTKYILTASTSVKNVDVDNVDWELYNNEQSILNNLVALGTYNNVARAKLKGKIHIRGKVGTSAIEKWLDYFGRENLTITVDEPTTSYEVVFKNHDNTILQTLTVFEGEDAIYTGASPIGYGKDYEYLFSHWDKELTNVTQDIVTTAQFEKNEPISFTLNLTNQEYLLPELNFVGFEGSCDISWGDGSKTSYTNEKLVESNPSHGYLKPGTYTISITLYPKDYIYKKNTSRYISFVDSPYNSSDQHYINKLININLTSFYTVIPSYFASNSNITTFVVPRNVETINSYAFYNCDLLTTIEFNENLKNINSDAFIGCSGLIELNLPKKLENIGAYAFKGCSKITKLDIPDSVKTIGYEAFSNCSKMEMVYLPTNLTTVSSYAFSGCSSLSKVYYRNTLENYLKISFSYNHYLFNYAQEFYLYNDSSEFYLLENFIVPNNITKLLPHSLHNYKGLKEITLHNQVTEIGSEVFSGCINVNSVTYLGTLEEWLNVKIGSQLSFKFDINVFYLYNNEGTLYSLTSLVLPDTLKEVPNYQFANFKCLTGLTLPNNELFTSIGNYAFYNCANLPTVNIPESVKTLGDYCFSGCTYCAEFIIPGVQDTDGTYLGVVSIPQGCFANCTTITNMTLPEGITFINSSAFSSCENLVSINIPNTVLWIQSNAFYNCPNLTNVVITDNSKLTQIYDSTFQNCVLLKTINIPPLVESIGSKAFESCTGLETVAIKNKVKTIGSYAFSRCSNLSSVTFEEGISLTSIPYSCFSGCTKLSEITIPEGVETIYECSFYNCSSLKTLYLPSTIKSFKVAAFKGCSDMVVYYKGTENDWCNISFYRTNTNVYPYYNSSYEQASKETSSPMYYSKDFYFFKSNAYKQIYSLTLKDFDFDANSTMFAGLKSLTSVTLTDGKTQGETFKNCTSLLNVTLSGKITLAGKDFYNCTSLSSITLPDSVTNLNSHTFYNCTKLSSIDLGNGMKSIWSDNFSDCIFTEIDIPLSFVYCDGTNIWPETLKTVNYEGTLKDFCKIYVRQINLHAKKLVGSLPFYRAETVYVLDDEGNKVELGEIIDIPDGVESIGDGTFAYLNKTKEINIPASVESIGTMAFAYSTLLEKIVVNDIIPPTVGTNFLVGCSSLQNIFVPYGTKATYSAATNWNTYTSFYKTLIPTNLFVIPTSGVIDNLFINMSHEYNYNYYMSILKNISSDAYIDYNGSKWYYLAYGTNDAKTLKVYIKKGTYTVGTNIIADRYDLYIKTQNVTINFVGYINQADSTIIETSTLDGASVEYGWQGDINLLVAGDDLLTLDTTYTLQSSFVENDITYNVGTQNEALKDIISTIITVEEEV